MQLKNIYCPVRKELESMERILKSSLKKSKNQSILRINNSLLESPGKRIRPALVILSAKASLNSQSPSLNSQLINIASAIELIHMASLIHDDVIDHARFRHNKPTVNSKWGDDISITLGDYLYSIAFELISDCGNANIVRCISSATKTMCEGEFLQVCERDNLDLLKDRYIVIVKKKTASLFAASCQAGALLFDTRIDVQNILREYGLNFGIAFQIIDDYLDIAGEEKRLGKTPGQDIEVGEVTLPLLNLLETTPKKERAELRKLLAAGNDKRALLKIKSKLLKSNALLRTKTTASSYMTLAKEKIDTLSHSPYKESLINLTDFVIERF